MREVAGLAIRLATESDLDAIAAIYAQVFDDMQPRLAVEQYLRPLGSWALIATLGSGAEETAAGYVLARTAAGETEIFSIGVALADQRRGIGQALMAATQEISVMRGADAIFLEVAVDNPAARALYGKCGFEVVGRRPEYYRNKGGNRVAALVLRLTSGIHNGNVT